MSDVLWRRVTSDDRQVQKISLFNFNPDSSLITAFSVLSSLSCHFCHYVEHYQRRASNRDKSAFIFPLLTSNLDR